MTRKDYELIAAAFDEELRWLRDQPAIADKQAQEFRMRSLANRFADKLILDNPRFDRARFFSACGF